MKLRNYLLGALVCVLIAAGCVSPETAAELDRLRGVSKVLAEKTISMAEKINDLRLEIRMGDITIDEIKRRTAEIDAERVLLAAEASAWKKQWDDTQDKAKEEGDSWINQLLYMIGVALGSVGLARKLGVPIIKSGSPPVNA